MTCSKCSTTIPEGSAYCPHCGTLQTTNANSEPERGRGGMIFAFGITSIVMLGPILGIPAWIMGRTDLAKIKDGLIAASEYSLTKAGMVMGIIGTFVSTLTVILAGIVIAVGLSLVAAKEVQSNRDAMIDDMNAIAASAHDYYLSHDRSYSGFELSEEVRSNEHARYTIFVLEKGMLRVMAVSHMRDENAIIAYVDGRGDLRDWEYLGDFQ